MIILGHLYYIICPLLENERTYRDQELFRQIALGDEIAFRELFDLYEPRIQPLIFTLVGAEAVVKDIIQDVFLQLWLGRSKLPEIEVPEKWIFKLVYNCSYSLLRKKIVRERYTEQLASGQIQYVDSNPTEELLVFAETSRLIRQAVGNLPPKTKQIFLLRESGMKGIEIAAELGISVQTVHNTISQSLKTIRNHLIKNGIEIPVFLILLFL